MENINQKYKKLKSMPLNNLITLHQMFCITLHPTWNTICNRYWKSIQKYRNPQCLVASKSNFYVLIEKITKVLGGVDEFCIQDCLLLDLLRYYNVEFYEDDKSLDRKTFSCLILYLFCSFSKRVSIYAAVYLALGTYFYIQDGGDLKIPSNFLDGIPILKEDPDFILWLNSNFTDTSSIERTINTALKAALNIPDSITTAKPAPDNKVFILKCREYFGKLLGLKSFEVKEKKVMITPRVEKKKSPVDSFEKYKLSPNIVPYKSQLPVEGKSIKLFIQSAVKNKPRPESPVDLKKAGLEKKGHREYRPELYDTLVRQYKHSSKKYSDHFTPEDLSPRFFKHKYENSRSSARLKSIVIEIDPNYQSFNKKSNNSYIKKYKFAGYPNKPRSKSSKLTKRMKRFKLNL